VSQSAEDSGNSVEVTIELVRPRSAHKAGGSLTLRFEGVRNLKVDQGSWSLMQFPLLEIRDIRARGWEGLAYQVVDNEHGVLSCACKDVLVESDCGSLDGSEM